MKKLKRKDPALQAWDLLWVSVILGLTGTLAGFMGGFWWFFDLASHFRVQLTLFFVITTVLFLFGKQKKKAGLSAVVMMINLALILPLYSGATTPDNNGRVYRALLINLNWSNQDHKKVLTYIKSVKPDFMILVEVTDAWAKSFESIQEDYSFSKIHPRPDNFGIALFSRIEPENFEIRTLGIYNLPTLVARFKMDGEGITLIGTHPPPPLGRDFARYRNEQLQELAKITSSEEGQVILMGDLNITSWSPFFRELLEQGGLKDSRGGFGPQPTWPAGFPLLRIPIDHILVSDGVVIHDRSIGPDVGSDHYPVVVDFSLGT